MESLESTKEAETLLGEFLKLSPAEVASLVPFVEFKRVSGTVFSFGDASEHVFVLLQGRVALTLHAQNLAVLSAPTFFGGIGLLDNTPRRSGCQTVRIFFFFFFFFFFFSFSFKVNGPVLIASVSRKALREHVDPRLALTLLFGIGSTVNQLLTG
jgi:CRP-like cAMP-binding protein